MTFGGFSEAMIPSLWVEGFGEWCCGVVDKISEPKLALKKEEVKFLINKNTNNSLRF
jgi:hypothetical protein